MFAQIAMQRSFLIFQTKMPDVPNVEHGYIACSEKNVRSAILQTNWMQRYALNAITYWNQNLKKWYTHVQIANINRIII